MSENIVVLSDDSFATEVLNAEKPVLVDFWAEWCGPCRMLIPILETVAKKLTGSVKVAKANVDECSQIAANYHIRSIPTLILFKQGQVVATQVGGLSETQLTQWIEDNL